MCGTYAWKPRVLGTGGFALDLTHQRPPIWWWSCHSCTADTRGNFQSTKEWPASLPWHMSFSSIRMREEATARHERVSALLLGSAHTHITSSTDPRCKAGSHTVTPWHGLTLCPLHCPCAFWLAITCKDFPWKDHMFQSYVFPYTPLPGFLPSHSIWRMGRWQQCSVGKTLQTIVTGISKELPFLRCCYNTAKGSFFKGFPTEGTVERIHKGEKHFLCVLLANCWQWNVLCPWEVFLTCGCVEGKREFPAEN